MAKKRYEPRKSRGLGWHQAAITSWTPQEINDGRLHFWIIEKASVHTLCGFECDIQFYSLIDFINRTPKCGLCENRIGV